MFIAIALIPPVVKKHEGETTLKQISTFAGFPEIKQNEYQFNKFMTITMIRSYLRLLIITVT